MIGRVLERLIELNYNLLDEHTLREAVTGGSKSIVFTKVIEWASKELQVLYSLDEHVNAITSPDDSSAFLLELSSFLKEIGCQYSILTEGQINERFQNEDNKILLLEFLITELRAARMMQANKKDDNLRVTLDESPTALVLKNMLRTLEFPRPPSDIPPKVLFDKVEAKLKEVTSKVPIALYGEALFTLQLSSGQWHTLEKYYKEWLLDYEIRREMLIKRLDVTIQSFEWSDRLKNKSGEIHAAIHPIRNKLNYEPSVRLSDILSARKDLAVLEKTSSASVRRATQSSINRVLIGTVPDRGGRPYEQEPPPPEMPSWQKRSAGPPGSSGGQGRSNFHNQAPQNDYDSRGNKSAPPIGGRVHAGWNERNDFRNSYNARPNQSYDTDGYSQDNNDREFNSRYYSGNRGHQYRGGKNNDYHNRYNHSQSYQR